MEQLTNTERLLLAQAVYQEGANDWFKVSQIISNHPLIGRPKTYFNPSICSSIYASMTHAAGLDGAVKDTAKPRADVNRRLAEIHYAARVTELRDLIFQEEARFKTVLTEIEEIRSGQWDERIKASLGIVSPEPTHDAPAAQEAPEVEEPTNEIEDVSMVDAEPPGRQDDPIIIDDSDATTDEPLVAQQVTQTLEEEEVDLHLTPDSIPPSPKPTEGANNVQEQDEATNEPLVQPVQKEATPHSPSTEQDLGEQDTQAVDLPELDQVPSPPAPPQETAADDEPEQEDAQEAVASEKDEPDTTAQPRRGKRKADAETDPKREKKSREISEPFEESEPEPAPTKKRRGTTSGVTSRGFQTVISLLHDQICQLRNGSIFHGPVKVSDAPDYYDIVRRPTDLKAIKTKIRDGRVTDSHEYQRDIYLMFANSMMYNRPDSDLYKMAEEMMLQSEHLIDQFRQTQIWNQ